AAARDARVVGARETVVANEGHADAAAGVAAVVVRAGIVIIARWTGGGRVHAREAVAAVGGARIVVVAADRRPGDAQIGSGERGRREGERQHGCRDDQRAHATVD